MGKSNKQLREQIRIEEKRKLEDKYNGRLNTLLFTINNLMEQNKRLTDQNKKLIEQLRIKGESTSLKNTCEKLIKYGEGLRLEDIFKAKSE